MDTDPRVDLAIVSNVPTPYRLHVLRRVAAEMPAVRLHSLFTHKNFGDSKSWEMALDPAVNPVAFPDAALPPGGLNPLRSRRLFRRIRDYLVEHRVRMVVLLGYNDLTRLMLIHWARRSGVPLLLTGDSNVHGEHRLGDAKRFVKRLYVGHVLRNIAGLMPMGSAGRAFFKLYGDPGLPTFLFPYEPDYDAIIRRDPERQAAFMAKHELASGRRRVLYCGRLAPVKRVDVLIDAFVKVAAERPDWDLVIAGDGPLKGELLARVPDPLRARVRWLGFLQFQDTATCYHCCDLLVLPSEYEPWALVINEAVAAGLAVIATDVAGAATELVRHGVNGMIVRSGQPDPLAAALRTATNPTRLLAMKAAAPAVLQHWRTVADPINGLRQALAHFRLP